MIEIKDSEGTVFDVEKHLLTDNSAAPFVTSTGKFRKLREGSVNSEDVIDRWNESLGKQSGEIQSQINEVPIVIYPASKPEFSAKKHIEDTILNATISDLDGQLLVIQGDLRTIISPNISAYDIESGLRSMGFVFK